MKPVFALKNDGYRRKRGGQAKFFLLSCAQCNTKLMLYQKDDPRGTLKRLYFDRIVAPKRLAVLAHQPMKSISILQCEKCEHLIGVPYIYPKEKRKAFLLSIGGVKKKVNLGEF